MFKENRNKIRIIILLLVEKGIRVGICHVIHRYAKASNKYMKSITKLKNHHILRI